MAYRFGRNSVTWFFQWFGRERGATHADMPREGHYEMQFRPMGQAAVDELSQAAIHAIRYGSTGPDADVPEMSGDPEGPRLRPAVRLTPQ